MGTELNFDWLALTPIIVILGTGAVQVLLEAFVPRRARRLTQLITSLLAVCLAFSVLAYLHMSDLYRSPVAVAGGEVKTDLVGIFAQLVLLLIGFLSILVFADRTSQNDGAFAGQPSDRPGSADEALSNRMQYQRTEIFPLLMFSLGGMLVFVQASSLLTMFVALEVMSLPLYILAASARRRRLVSQEAGMKYFILGAFASAFFLMGAALFFSIAGSVEFTRLNPQQLAQIVQSGGAEKIILFPVAMLLVLVGLLFKVAAVPFHAWTPDVYQGAPTPVTGFMAAGVKVAAFVALLRIADATVVGFFPGVRWVFWTVAALTIVYGTVMGLRQTDVKRMLAYSSIAHAGFLLIAIVSVRGLPTFALLPVMFYLLTYGLATVGAFAIVTLVRERNQNGDIVGEATSMKLWAGLGKTNPFLAACMSIFLLSFAGIPLTAGFIGKFWVFMLAVSAGATPLVVLAVLASAATAVFYFRLIRTMFFEEPTDNSVVVASEGYSSFAIAFTTAVTVVLGILPTLVINLLA
ncbi:NADH-quinone oxidoreductase subunit NuoN [Actinomycetaceae bacterium TAE3-ERU4]|nr:NADH-quinone oxidoreductase subunit NuoN [Actinomycetaceae bacterium TAE3-ERU4]